MESLRRARNSNRNVRSELDHRIVLLVYPSSIHSKPNLPKHLFLTSFMEESWNSFFTMSLSVLKFQEQRFLNTNEISDIMRDFKDLKQNSDYCSYADEFRDTTSELAENWKEIFTIFYSDCFDLY